MLQNQRASRGAKKVRVSSTGFHKAKSSAALVCEGRGKSKSTCLWKSKQPLPQFGACQRNGKKNPDHMASSGSGKGISKEVRDLGPEYNPFPLIRTSNQRAKRCTKKKKSIGEKRTTLGAGELAENSRLPEVGQSRPFWGKEPNQNPIGRADSHDSAHTL